MEADQSARRAKRLKIFEPFALINGAGELRAHLLDISETGALVHCPGDHIAGAPVTLRIKERSFVARIMWAEAPRLGVAFNERITADMVETLLGR